VSDPQAVKTLAHELAHAILRENAVIDRASAELEAESVAYIVTSELGAGQLRLHVRIHCHMGGRWRCSDGRDKGRWRAHPDFGASDPERNGATALRRSRPPHLGVRTDVPTASSEAGVNVRAHLFVLSTHARAILDAAGRNPIRSLHNVAVVFEGLVSGAERRGCAAHTPHSALKGERPS
jgi:hypothetical protein